MSGFVRKTPTDNDRSSGPVPASFGTSVSIGTKCLAEIFSNNLNYLRLGRSNRGKFLGAAVARAGAA